MTPKVETLEAVQFNGLEDYLSILDWMNDCKWTCANECSYSTPEMSIHTLRGRETARPGDWVVRLPNGDFVVLRTL